MRPESDPLALLDLMLATAHVDGAPRVVVDKLREIRQALLCERCRLSPAERGSLPRMPDVPGSGPPDPDNQSRLEEVVEAARSGVSLPGLTLSPGIIRFLAASSPVHGAVDIGGVPHLLYEAFGVGFLSPAVE